MIARTEEQIIYQLLNIYYGGAVSNDDEVSERLMRDFLRKHRANKLPAFYKNGDTIDDQIFQELDSLKFDQDSNGFYTTIIPPLIHFEDNSGLSLSKSNFVIPIVNRSAFLESIKNVMNRSFPKAYHSGNKLTIYPGLNNSCDVVTSERYIVVDDFMDQIGSSGSAKYITANFRGVFYDPSSVEDYDWTKDPYPCPSEIIAQITTSVLAADLNLMIRTKSDQVGNLRSDKLQDDGYLQ